jgi:DnaJ-domain-containing protein 1
MGIFDRLGTVINSYLNSHLHDEDERVFGGSSRAQAHSADPDLEAAFEELNDYLGGRERRETSFSGGEAGHSGGGRPPGGNRDFRERGAGQGKPGQGTLIPETLRGDFAELGLPFGASADECKQAYKRLLKQHHPDRHAGHPGNMKKATEKSARINAAFDRIERWRATGKTE